MKSLSARVEKELGKLCKLVDAKRTASTVIGVTLKRNHCQQYREAYMKFRDNRTQVLEHVRLQPFSKKSGKPVCGYRQSRKAMKLYGDSAANPSFRRKFRLIARIGQLEQDQRPRSRTSAGNVDKLICRAMAWVLNELLRQPGPEGRPVQYEHSYAYRRDKSGHGALKTMEQWIEAGYTHVARTDIKAFFDQIDLGIMGEKLERFLSAHGIADSRYLSWVQAVCSVERGFEWKVLKGDDEEIFRPCVFADNKRGIPQGNALSAPLANLYLTDTDFTMEKQGTAKDFRYLRYADDIVICAREAKIAMDGLEALRKKMRHLKLEIEMVESPGGARPVGHTGKGDLVDLCDGSTLHFLGFSYRLRGGILQKEISREKIDKFRRKILGVTSHQRQTRLLEAGKSRDDLMRRIVTDINLRLAGKPSGTAKRQRGHNKLSSRSFVAYYAHDFEEERDCFIRSQLAALDRFIRWRVACFVEGAPQRRAPEEYVSPIKRLSQRMRDYNETARRKGALPLKLLAMTTLMRMKPWSEPVQYGVGM